MPLLKHNTSIASSVNVATKQLIFWHYALDYLRVNPFEKGGKMKMAKLLDKMEYL